MTRRAPTVCRTADRPGQGPPSPDLLLVLLEVSRSGRYTTAGESLGLNHTTVARKIGALERAAGGRVLARAAGGWELTALGERLVGVGAQIADLLRQVGPDGSRSDPVAGVVRLTATDGFSAYVAAPAIAALRRDHPGLGVEIVTVTRRAMSHRSGVDIEVVVGEPQVHRAEAFRLGDYTLGMYAARDYLEEHGTPRSVAELSRHGLVYFVDSMLQVDDLDAPRRLVPGMRDGLTSTNVFVHVEATRAGAGIGFLPCFMADRHTDLVRVLAGMVEERLTYWMVLRPEGLRQPAIAAVVAALREEMGVQQPLLTPGARTAPAGSRGSRGSRGVVRPRG